MYAIRSYYEVFSKEMSYIIFTSPRAGGFGEIDLYIAFKKADGEWTDGINMGPAINTDGRITSYNVCYTKLLR